MKLVAKVVREILLGQETQEDTMSQGLQCINPQLCKPHLKKNKNKDIMRNPVWLVRKR